MKNNKRVPKRLKTFRFAPASLEVLAKLRERTGWSESAIMEMALATYYSLHSEYWPVEKPTEAAK